MPKRYKIHRFVDRYGESEGACPRCGEILSFADLESYAVCPFCGCLLEQDAALEDFILTPVIRQWIGSTGITR
ncbi:MAG: hypothetical protein PHS41_00095 [Victivallaceae bacterium]|nr:hypothetical protein [Victivallaceae bacterium]